MSSNNLNFKCFNRCLQIHQNILKIHILFINKISLHCLYQNLLIKNSVCLLFLILIKTYLI